MLVRCLRGFKQSRRSWAWLRLGLVALLSLDNAASAALLDISIVYGSSSGDHGEAIVNPLG